MFPLAVAVIVVIDGGPANPILSMPDPALVNPPVPAKAVVTVNVLLFVSVIPVTVILGIENVPVRACKFVSNVCIPVPAVKVPLLIIPPRNVTGELPELFQVPPELTVTNPVNIFTPAAADMVKLPLDPPPIVAEPTVKANPAAVNVVPSPMLRLPVIPRPTTVVVLTVPLNVKLPQIVVVVASNVLTPEPERFKL